MTSHHPSPATSIRPATLALHAVAAIAALSAAALASNALVAQQADVARLAIISAATPDHIAGTIEPATPVRSVVATPPAGDPPSTIPTPVARPLALAEAIPPKPVPRPCLECRAAPVTAMPIATGGEGGAGASALLVRGRDAVVAGGGALVSAAWNLPGAAIGGLVQGVRRLPF